MMSKRPRLPRRSRSGDSIRRPFPRSAARVIFPASLTSDGAFMRPPSGAVRRTVRRFARGLPTRLSQGGGGYRAGHSRRDHGPQLLRVREKPLGPLFEAAGRCDYVSIRYAAPGVDLVVEGANRDAEFVSKPAFAEQLGCSFISQAGRMAGSGSCRSPRSARTTSSWGSRTRRAMTYWRRTARRQFCWASCRRRARRSASQARRSICFSSWRSNRSRRACWTSTRWWASRR